MALLDIQNLNVIYKTPTGDVLACDGVNLSIEPQSSIGIVGESGSGKSTMAMAVLRLLPKNTSHVEGKVLLDGVDLLSLNQKELNAIRWKEIAVVFQKAMNSLSPVHKIGRQMTDIYRIHEPNASDAEVRARIFELLDVVNLSDRVFNLYPHELSGGMMQRISIAVSLLHNPKMLIMDEATTALDVVTEGQILSEIAAIQKKFNLTRMMITHDISTVASSCENIAVMYAGCIVETGNTQKVLTNPPHPYTKALLAAFPNFRGQKTSLASIPGSLPNLKLRQPGCLFAPRCAYATEQCLQSKPPLRHPEPGRNVYCHCMGGDLHE